MKTNFLMILLGVTGMMAINLESLAYDDYYRSRRYDYRDRYDSHDSRYDHRSFHKRDKSALKDPLRKAIDELRQIQKRCDRRSYCIEKAEDVLNSMQRRLDRYDSAYDTLREIEKQIRVKAADEIFLTQKVLYDQMSSVGQKEYKSGIRVRELKDSDFRRKRESHHKHKHKHKHKNDDYNFDRIGDVRHYNKDDILNIAIQGVEANHRHCRSRTECLRDDIKSISSLIKELDRKDASREALNRAIDLIERQESKQIFDAARLVEVYLREPNRIYSWNPQGDALDSWRKISKADKISVRDAKLTNIRELKKLEKKERKREKSKQWEKALDALFGVGSDRDKDRYRDRDRDYDRGRYDRRDREQSSSKGKGLLEELGSLFQFG